MAAKDVFFGDKARAGMLEGVNILADAVKASPSLAEITLEHLRPAHTGSPATTPIQEHAA